MEKPCNTDRLMGGSRCDDQNHTWRAAISRTSCMGSALGSVEGLAVYKQGTSVSRNSQSALTMVATCRQVESEHNFLATVSDNRAKPA